MTPSEGNRLVARGTDTVLARVQALHGLTQLVQLDRASAVGHLTLGERIFASQFGREVGQL